LQAGLVAGTHPGHSPSTWNSPGPNLAERLLELFEACGSSRRKVSLAAELRLFLVEKLHFTACKRK
jgi:hypothetical protein